MMLNHFWIGSGRKIFRNHRRRRRRRRRHFLSECDWFSFFLSGSVKTGESGKMLMPQTNKKSRKKVKVILRFEKRIENKAKMKKLLRGLKKNLGEPIFIEIRSVGAGVGVGVGKSDFLSRLFFLFPARSQQSNTPYRNRTATSSNSLLGPIL